MLNLDDFSDVIKNAPLVSIDLIVKGKQGVLLGKRSNQPAKGYWFVPGGRILKNETIVQAVERIALKELNLKRSLSDFEFRGVFEHFYDNSFVSESITTHYVVLAFEVEENVTLMSLPSSEHDAYRFFNLDELESNHLVHMYTKKYFNSEGVA
jgi:colanic acid biosynthesis protein WcaH